MEQKLRNVRLHQGIPNTDYFQTFLNKPGLKVLIFDDLMSILVSNKDVEELMLCSSHHRRCVVLYTAQSIFNNRGVYSRSQSANTHIFFIMNSSRNLDSILIFARQVVGSGPAYKSFQKIWEDNIWNKPYSYLCINCSPSTPADFRLSTDIFSDKPTKVFVIKQH